jgi:phosphate:Na+ symporter
MRFGLKKMLGNRLKDLLIAFCLSPWRGLLAGIVASALLQGSTAVSLITIGLVSAEYLSFYQGLSIILGANIGTCSTVQLMSLPLFEELNYPFIIAITSIGLLKKRTHTPAIAMIGIFSMFWGLTILYQALSTLTSVDSVLNYLTRNYTNPFYCILCGIIITFLVQSSSAVTGILMALTDQGVLDLMTSAYIVYGNNIGSCLSSLLVGSAAPIAAKRLAMAHFVLNILGVMFFFPFTGLLTLIISEISTDFGWQVAMIHTTFNVLSSLLILPFIKQYGRFISFLLPENNRTKK